jgi:hypothetical protein
MTTASTRIWTFATVIVIIIVVALGWFVGISPKLADAARFDADRRAVIAQNDAARVILAQLQADFEQLDELLLELEELRAEFPTDAAYDDAIEEMLNGMLAAGLALENVAINEPAPTTATVLADGAEAPAPEVDGEGLLPAGSLLRVSVSVTVNGALPAILSYIDALQQSPRFAIISTGDYAAAAGTGGEMTFSMIMYVVSGEDLLDVEPEVELEPEPAPTETPTPEATDPAGTDPSATPTPTP